MNSKIHIKISNKFIKFIESDQYLIKVSFDKMSVFLSLFEIVKNFKSQFILILWRLIFCPFSLEFLFLFLKIFHFSVHFDSLGCSFDLFRDLVWCHMV